jgi:sterol 3beta-glucosyltransferase
LTTSWAAIVGTAVDFGMGLTDVLVTPVFAYRTNNKERREGTTDHSLAGAAGKTAAGGFGNMTSSIMKGSFVDFPVALTEGLHQVPTLYGETPRDHGVVDSAKSGVVVAGKVRPPLSVAHSLLTTTA